MRRLMNTSTLYLSGMTRLLWLMMLFPVACSKLETESSVQPEKLTIDFTLELVGSKAAPNQFTGSGVNHTIRQFGVFARVNGTVPYMNNLIVSRSDLNSPWTYSPQMYWPADPVDFYAYAHNDPFSGPRVPTGADDVAGIREVQLVSGVPRIAMTVDSYPHFQIDLLLAEAQKGRTKTAGAIGLSFKHVMAKITFSARAKFDPGTHATAKITDIIIRNVFDTGEIEMDAAKEWTVNTTLLPRKYWLHIINTESGKQELNDLELTTSYQMLSSSVGVLLLMPQVLSDDARVEIRYVTSQPHTIIMPLKSITPQWGKGTAINYQIEIDNSL